MRGVVLACCIVVLATIPYAATAQTQPILTVVTHDSFAVSEHLLAEFENKSGYNVRILRSGDTGAMVNQSILSKNNPLGDVMYGIDNTFLTRALNAELFIPYESPLLEYVPQTYVTDPEHRVTPIDFGDVCLNYDVAYFETAGLVPPERLMDLTDPAYRSLLVVENPAVSSPGLAFLLTTIGTFGVDDSYDYLDFWQALVDNDVLVVDDWINAYYGHFSAASDGDRPIVVSYASSPPAEVFFAEEPPERAPTASITEPGTCFRQIEFAGILARTKHLQAAQAFVDFLLSKQVQEDLPLQMFVFPVSTQASLPEVFIEYATLPEEPAILDIEEIEAQREAWIQAWMETVLR